MKKLSAVIIALLVFLSCRFGAYAYECDAFKIDIPEEYVQSESENGTVIFKNSKTNSVITLGVSKNKGKAGFVSMPKEELDTLAQNYVSDFLESVNSSSDENKVTVSAETKDYGERALGNTKGFYIELALTYKYQNKSEESFSEKIYLLSDENNVISVSVLSKTKEDEVTFEKALESFTLSGTALEYSAGQSGGFDSRFIPIGIILGLVLGCLVAVLKVNRRESKRYA